MAISADFSTLWSSLPQWSDARKITPPDPATHKQFPQMPGMNIPISWETCCIQMSHAFNTAGLPIDYVNKTRVIHDPAGNEYMLDVAEMRGYLAGSYGDPEVHPRSDSNGATIARLLTEAALSGRHGVLAFGGRHIDLWDGARIHGEGYNLAALWEAPSALRDGVYFWEVYA